MSSPSKCTRVFPLSSTFECILYGIRTNECHFETQRRKRRHGTTQSPFGPVRIIATTNHLGTLPNRHRRHQCIHGSDSLASSQHELVAIATLLTLTTIEFRPHRKFHLVFAKPSGGHLQLFPLDLVRNSEGVGEEFVGEGSSHIEQLRSVDLFVEEDGSVHVQTLLEVQPAFHHVPTRPLPAHIGNGADVFDFHHGSGDC
mmetsp:Transcript_32354/g.32657  ORF Transcript_32354/g.32657 Transcript_32354/m.32657 type:complete len:200 (-) Transcript_32354:310-909(-)